MKKLKLLIQIIATVLIIATSSLVIYAVWTDSMTAIRIAITCIIPLFFCGVILDKIN